MSCHEFLKERRGLLCRLLQDLDALLAPGSGTRAKIVVLKNVMIIQKLTIKSSFWICSILMVF